MAVKQLPTIGRNLRLCERHNGIDIFKSDIDQYIVESPNRRQLWLSWHINQARLDAEAASRTGTA